MSLTNAYVTFWGAAIMLHLTQSGWFLLIMLLEAVFIVLTAVVEFCAKGEQGE